MWGCSSNYPTITSYDQARDEYESIKPLRGTKDFRPLDARSARAKSQIRKDGETYVIRLYSTDILTYFPDGSIRVCGSNWNTQATRAAIYSMSPFYARSSQGGLAVSVRNGYLKVEGGTFVVPSKGLLFKPDAGGVLRPVDPPTAYETKVRVRQAEARARREYFKQVPKLIEAYCAAFVGGEALSSHMPTWSSFNDEVLDEADASNIAMLYVPRQRDWTVGFIRYKNDPKRGIQQFWSDVYLHYDLRETYKIELPYGVVV